MKFLVFLLCLFITTTLCTRINIGGSLRDDNSIFTEYKNLRVGVITAAGSPRDAASVIRNMISNGAISAIRLELQGGNCARQANNQSLATYINNNIDAIYMTGGQPISLHSCLYGNPRGTNPRETAVLTSIKRLKLVGGSSAGSLVQPEIATLTAGYPYSYDAILSGSVTFSRDGTKILKPNVIIDVHFSERGRQGRIHVLQHITGIKYAFGIDEDTSLLTEANGIKRVSGKGGVYVLENVDKNTAIYHYLTEGDTITPNGHITFASWKSPCALHNRRPSSSRTIFTRNMFTTLAKELVTYGEVFTFKSYQGRTRVVTVSMTRTEPGYCGSHNRINHVSWRGLRVNYQTSSSKELGFSAEEYSERYHSEK